MRESDQSSVIRSSLNYLYQQLISDFESSQEWMQIAMRGAAPIATVATLSRNIYVRLKQEGSESPLVIRLGRAFFQELFSGVIDALKLLMQIPSTLLSTCRDVLGLLLAIILQIIDFVFKAFKHFKEEILESGVVTCLLQIIKHLGVFLWKIVEIVGKKAYDYCIKILKCLFSIVSEFASSLFKISSIFAKLLFEMFQELCGFVPNVKTLLLDAIVSQDITLRQLGQRLILELINFAVELKVEILRRLKDTWNETKQLLKTVGVKLFQLFRDQYRLIWQIICQIASATKQFVLEKLKPVLVELIKEIPAFFNNLCAFGAYLFADLISCLASILYNILMIIIKLFCAVFKTVLAVLFAYWQVVKLMRVFRSFIDVEQIAVGVLRSVF